MRGHSWGHREGLLEEVAVLRSSPALQCYEVPFVHTQSLASAQMGGRLSLARAHG